MIMEHWKNLSITDIEGEEWSPIPINTNYLASNKGKIKCIVDNHKGKTDKEWIVKQTLIICKNRYNYNRIISKLFFKHKHRITISTSRLIMMAFYGQSDKVVNHIDRDSTNNMVENLEYVTQTENIIHNSLKKRGNLYTGVTFWEPTNKYRASIKINQKIKYLGYYHNPKIAHAVYCRYREDNNLISKYI